MIGRCWARYMAEGVTDLPEDLADRVAASSDGVLTIFFHPIVAVFRVADGDSAQDAIHDALARARALGLPQTSCIGAAAATAMLVGDAPRAARLWGYGGLASILEAYIHPLRTRTRDALGAEAFDRLCEEGAELTEDQALTLALGAP